MQRALELARDALGTTSPNPPVGAVVVREGRVIGEGAYAGPGTPHAEIVALERAGEAARGATVYVTLEPCNHSITREGQPRISCVRTLIAASVARVVYSLEDPDERTAGRGAASLAAAGIAVEAGEGEDEARKLLEGHVKHRAQGMPFVIAKFAASLDGRIAAASGDSRWVAGEDAREWAHQMRCWIDAIVVGSSTVLVDDPLLTARPGGKDAERQPLRVVVDTRGRTPPMARVFTGPSKTLVATVEDSPVAWRAAVEARGAEVVSFPREGEHVALPALLRELAKRDVVTALVEGGGVLLGSFFDHALVDKVHAVISPMIIGAADAPAAVAGKGAYRMVDALRLRDVEWSRKGEDMVVVGYPVYPEPAD